MAGESCLNHLNQLIVNTAKGFFERNSGVDIVSPHVLKINYKMEGVLKYFDRGLVPHAEHDDYESDIFLAQKD